MSRYDGLIIPRSYSEYLNKTDSATLSQMLQHLTGLWSHAVSSGDNKPVTSDAVYEALTDAATLQQALQVPGVLSEAVAAGDNKAVKSSAVYEALTDAATIQQALQLPGVLSEAVAAGDNKAVTSNAVNGALANYVKYINYEGTTDDKGLLNLSSIGDYIPIFAKNFPYITNFFNGTSVGYNPYVRIIDYNNTPYANQSVSMRLCVLPFSNT